MTMKDIKEMQLSIKQAIIDGRLYVNAASLPDQRTLLVFVPGWTLAPKKFGSSRINVKKVFEAHFLRDIFYHLV